MATFIFKLEPVLKMRKHAENILRREVAQLEQAKTTLKESLRTRQQRLSDSKNAVRDQLVGSVDLSHIRLQATAGMGIMRDAQRNVLELAGLHRKLEVARLKLAEAAKERRAIELLRERRFDQWRAEQSRREEAAFDDMSTTRSGRFQERIVS
jgi:flagellar FliJ protein